MSKDSVSSGFESRLVQSRVLELALQIADLYARLLVSEVPDKSRLDEQYSETIQNLSGPFWDLGTSNLELIQKTFETSVLREVRRHASLASWVPPDWRRPLVEDVESLSQEDKTDQPASQHRDQVFVSYSHSDKAWLERLQVHLKPLEREGNVKVWDDTKISSGQRWKEEIGIAVQRAKVAILLISADFLASDFISTDELPPLLEAAEAGGAVVLPVIVSPCLFNESRLSEFQAVNSPDMPLTAMNMTEKEKVFVDVSRRVMIALKE